MLWLLIPGIAKCLIGAMMMVRISLHVPIQVSGKGRDRCILVDSIGVGCPFGGSVVIIRNIHVGVIRSCSSCPADTIARNILA